MTVVNTRKSVKKPQKQKYVVGMGPQGALSVLEVICVQEVSRALVCLEMETEVGMGAGKHE